jgi:integrase
MKMSNSFVFTAAKLGKLPKTAGVWRDKERPGLIVRRQSDGGDLTYYFRFRLTGSNGSGRMRLGRIDEITLATARQMAENASGDTRKGVNPQDARRRLVRAAEAEKAAGQTLDEFLDRYLEDRMAKGIVSAPERVSALRRLLPKLMKEPIKDLSRGGVVSAVNDVSKAYPAAARKLTASLHHVFEKALDWGDIDDNPLAGRRGDNDRSRKAKNVEEEEKEGAALSIDDLARVWIAAGGPKVNSAFRAFVRVMIATGARRNELAAARIGQLKAADAELPARLVLPASTTKTGKSHTLYLPPLALAEIENLTRRDAETLVFPARRRRAPVPRVVNGKIEPENAGIPLPTSAPLSGWSKMMPAVVEAARALGVDKEAHVHLHGLRRGFRTGLSALGVPVTIAEMMLNHSREKLIATYDRHAFDRERAGAAVKWCDALSAAIAKVEAAMSMTAPGSNVTDIRLSRASRGGRAAA